MSTGFYEHVFGPKLQQRMEAFNQVDSDALDLRSEIALMRSVVADAVDMYSTAMEKDEQGKVIINGHVVAELLKKLKDLVYTASRVEALQGNLITRDMLAVMARQITQAAYDVFGEADERAGVFLDRVSDLLFNPMDSTQIAPEKLVQLMLETVPAGGDVIDVPSGNGNGKASGNGNGSCSPMPGTH